MKFDIDQILRIGPPALCIIGIIYFEVLSWSEDPSYTDIAINGTFMIASFLLWIVVLLTDLNAHFKKLEKDDDDEIH